jgi:hypothetical protein
MKEEIKLKLENYKKSTSNIIDWNEEEEEKFEKMLNEKYNQDEK